MLEMFNMEVNYRCPSAVQPPSVAQLRSITHFSYLRCILKTSLSIALLSSWFTLTFLFGRSLALQNLSATMLLKVFGVRLKVKGFRNYSNDSIIVANHLSYLDPIIMAAITKASFISSKQLASMPLIGTLLKRAGVYLIDRKRITELPTALKDINSPKTIRPVMFFPEGTTTNGEFLLPFRSSLFETCVTLRLKTIPVVIQYTHINGKPITLETRDLICWYDSYPILTHLKTLLGAQSIHVEIYFLPEFETQNLDRKGIALTAKQEIERNLRLFAI